ncbi:MAG TPA: dienelactone hydrolase family protein [Azospirillum sp.]|nr:dienelactone hydrolase family protein [Azospirillum sp.]
MQVALDMLFAFASRAVLGIALLAVSVTASPAATAPGKTNATEIVGFPSKDADVNGEEPTRLSGRIMRPDGPGPFPAVVMLHGCSGLYTKAGALAARHLWWARTLREQGYLVLLVDSFGPRGIDEQCSEKDRKVRASVERKRDAWGALDFLRTRPDVLTDRIAVLGWSQGGGAVLAALSSDRPEPGFRAAVAFYPGCRVSLSNPDWQPGGPLLILIGEKDDWTPAAPCEELAGRDSLKDRLELVVYPNTHHDFDLPSTPVSKRKGVAVAPTGEVHVGTNETARADAVARVTAFLAKLLKEG